VRKSPCRHNVRSHVRSDGDKVHSYIRGHGQLLRRRCYVQRHGSPSERYKCIFYYGEGPKDTIEVSAGSKEEAMRLALLKRQHQTLIPRIILEESAKKSHVIYGAQAMNVQLPSELRRPTEDFDIYVHDSKEEAETLRKLLSKRIPNGFYIEPAEHLGTQRLKRRVNGFEANVADLTSPMPEVKVKSIGKVRYQHLQEIKKEKEETVYDPQRKYRLEKDLADLARIQLAEGRLV
jgi:hypothetical protein